MEREACVCDHGFERSDLCAEIIIIIMHILCWKYCAVLYCSVCTVLYFDLLYLCCIPLDAVRKPKPSSRS